MVNWDKSVDLLIAGSGGGGMVAALAALDSGIEPLVVEKQDLVGGSTGMSGGMVWLPNNPLMRDEGIPDSHEDGLAYFDDVVGDIGEVSSPARREMFLTAGSEMIDFLVRKGVRLVRCPGWSDYYPNHKGGNAAGRSVEGIPYDAAELGDWSDKVQPSMAKNYGFVVKTNELRAVQYFNRSPRAFAVAMRVFLRTKAAKLRRRDLMTNGASLIGQMLKILIEGGEPPVWTNAAMEDLIVEDGRVVGARVNRNGATVNVQARKGVLLAAGGFSRNADMRRRYSGDQPNDGKWSIANAGDTGEVLQTAMDLGAKTDLLDEAWWLPMVFIADPGARIARVRAAASRCHLRRRDRQAVLQRVELLCRGRQGDVRQQGGAVLAGLRRGLRRPVCVGSQPAEEAHPVRGLDHAGCRQACGYHRRPRSPDRCSRRCAGGDGQALQRVCGQGPRPRLRPRPVGVQRLPRRSRLQPERRARPARHARRTTPPGCSRPTSGPAGA